MLRHQRCNLWAKPGMGKTLLAYSVLQALDPLGLESRPSLVLAPLRVARDTWPDEAQRWAHLSDLTVEAVTGDPEQRRAALRRDAQVYTCNYENLPWLVEQCGDRWPFGTVVADESTKIKSFRMTQGGKRAHALAKVAWTDVNRWINLTGTPCPNGVKDLWGQNWFIDQGMRLGRTFTAFQERWFSIGYDRVLKPMPHALDQVKALLADVTMTLDPKDWFDLKDPIVTQIKVKLPPAAQKIYKRMEKDMFTELSCMTEVEVFNAAAKTNKCLQLANGGIFVDGKWKRVHDEKHQALESLVDELGEQVIVSYEFVPDAESIIEYLGPKRAALISKPEGMRRFLAGDVQVGLAHPASLGHGVDGLQAICNRLIRFGDGWNLENRLQILERIGPMRQFQADLDRSVFIYDLIAEDTIDEDVLLRHETKAEVMSIMMNAMKVRK